MASVDPLKMANSKALTPQSPLQAAMKARQDFRAVESSEQLQSASIYWAEVRTSVINASEVCSEQGALKDREIYKGALDDLFKAPVSLAIALAELFIAIEDDSPDAVKEIKEVLTDLRQIATGQALDKVREVALKRLRNALTKYLKSRTVAQLSKVLTSVRSVLLAYGGQFLAAVNASRPSVISDDVCGLAALVDEAAADAAKRVFGDEGMSKWPLATPSASTTLRLP